MMTPRHAWLVLVALLMVSAETASGHHSFAAEFDDSRTIQVQGVVTEFRLVNPHATMSITGNPTHSGSRRLAFRRLVRADGTELVGPGDKVLDAIEEQRRERARQRSQQQ